MYSRTLWLCWLQVMYVWTYTCVCAHGTNISEGVMYPNSFEGVFRIDTVEDSFSSVIFDFDKDSFSSVIVDFGRAIQQWYRWFFWQHCRQFLFLFAIFVQRRFLYLVVEFVILVFIFFSYRWLTYLSVECVLSASNYISSLILSIFRLVYSCWFYHGVRKYINQFGVTFVALFVMWLCW